MSAVERHPTVSGSATCSEIWGVLKIATRSSQKEGDLINFIVGNSELF